MFAAGLKAVGLWEKQRESLRAAAVFKFSLQVNLCAAAAAGSTPHRFVHAEVVESLALMQTRLQKLHLEVSVVLYVGILWDKLDSDPLIRKPALACKTEWDSCWLEALLGLVLRLERRAAALKPPWSLCEERCCWVDFTFVSWIHRFYEQLKTLLRAVKCAE